MMVELQSLFTIQTGKPTNVADWSDGHVRTQSAHQTAIIDEAAATLDLKPSHMSISRMQWST